MFSVYQRDDFPASLLEHPLHTLRQRRRRGAWTCAEGTAGPKKKKMSPSTHTAAHTYTHTHFRRVSTDGRGSEVRQNLDERFPACEPHVVIPQNGSTFQSKSITY